MSPEQVFKTLVARGDRTGAILACIPANAELDLRALAAASGNKKVELVPVKEVLGLTGYVRGGVSPSAPGNPTRSISTKPPPYGTSSPSAQASGDARCSSTPRSHARSRRPPPRHRTV